MRDVRRRSSTHARVHTQRDAFSIPRIHPRTATPWPTFISGNNRHKRTPLVHPRAESLPLVVVVVPLPSPVYGALCTCTCTPHALQSAWQLRITNESGEFVVRSFVFTCNYTRRDVQYLCCSRRLVFARYVKLCASTILGIYVYEVSIRCMKSALNGISVRKLWNYFYIKPRTVSLYLNATK